jgi:hypothetical protein
MEFIETSTSEYWDSVLKGAFWGGIFGGASSAYVQGTNVLGGSYKEGWWIRTAISVWGNIITESQSPDRREHSLGGLFDIFTFGGGSFFGVRVLPQTPFFNELGFILLLDDLLQTYPTKIFRWDPRSGYGSPINSYFRFKLCANRPWLPICPN